MAKAHSRQALDKSYFGKKGSTVNVINNNINGALAILKKRNNEEGLNKELRDREYFLTKTQKRRKEKAAAKRRFQKKLAEQKQIDSTGIFAR